MKKKSGLHTSGCIQHTVDQGINLLATLYAALLNTFFCLDYSFLSLKEQQRFRLHEHCLTCDLARSTHSYMHVSHESDFDSFESNNLQFFSLACVVGL